MASMPVVILQSCVLCNVVAPEKCALVGNLLIAHRYGCYPQVVQACNNGLYDNWDAIEAIWGHIFK